MLLHYTSIDDTVGTTGSAHASIVGMVNIGGTVLTGAEVGILSTSIVDVDVDVDVCHYITQ